MALSRALFRKIAAATAVVCDELGGEVGRLDLMKILFSSDRTMLDKRERTITGDCYFSLPKGPILSCTLNLAKGVHGGPLQKEWDSAFQKVEHASCAALVFGSTQTVFRTKRKTRFASRPGN